MKRLSFLLILFSFLSACQKNYNKTKHAYNFIPAETITVIEVNELNDFMSSIENHDILSQVYDRALNKASKFLSKLNTTDPIYISFFEPTDVNSNYLVLTNNKTNVFKTDSIPNIISETLLDFSIEKTQIDSTIIYHKTFGNVFAGSNDLDLIKSLDDQNQNTALVKLIETTDKKSVASIVFKSDSPTYSKLLFSSIDAKDYTVLDLSNMNKNLQYNGIITTRDSIDDKLRSFKSTIPQKINTPNLAPNDIGSLTSITYNDYAVFAKNMHQLNNAPIDSTQVFLNYTNEIALVDNALILHTLDSKLLIESIEEKSNIETFRGVDIYEFGSPDFFTSNLKPFIEFKNATFFMAYENFVVFSNSIENLKSILVKALNNNTLANSDAFITISEKLSDEASLFIFKNSDGLSELIGKDLKGYHANAVQFIYDDNYAHVNGIIQKTKKRQISNSVTEAFTVQVDAPIIAPAQTLKNHITKAHDIAIQDLNNTLYLISSQGNVLWKKQLQGTILGQIEQIDMYKNGRLQLVFATSSRVYILDRNGKNVAPFPLKFNDAITQPLSVFDYDKRKNYRLLVTQGENLLMYDANGKSIKGFNYASNNGVIKTQPKHFRIGSKDYIVFGADEALKILNRQGKTRINVKDKIRFSENEIFLYQNKFSTTNTLGQLIQVDTKGRLSAKDLNLTDKHYLETTSKTLVSLRENKLAIKSRNVDLDYGEYTPPKIFYINDKIYVSTTDLQSNKVYLFDSQAKPIPNFPVFGTSGATLEELDKDKGLELITQSDENTITIYKLH